MPIPPASSNAFVITFDPLDSRSSGKVAQLADGRFVVTWTDFGSGTSDMTIGFRIMNADGSVGSPNRTANNVSKGAQEGVFVTALSDGGFALAWTDSSSNTSGADVSYRVYGADGLALGDQTTFAVDSFQTLSTVRATTNGGFVLGWQDGATSDAMAQEFDGSGVALGMGPIRISDGDGFDSGPIFAIDETGFTSVWGDAITSATPGVGGIFSRTFSTFPADDYVTEGSVVSDTDFSAFGRLTDATLSAGTLGVVWLNGTGQNSFVNLKIGNNAAVLVGTGTAEFEGDAQIAALPTGGFVVTWTEILNNDPDVYGRTYDLAGVATSDPFLVTDAAARQNTPDVAVLQDGRILFTFDSGETDGNFLRGRFFDPRTEPLFLNGDGNNNQFVGTNFVAGDTIGGVAGSDTLWGAAGADILDGGAAADVLYGGSGADRLYGGNGRDIISGGIGADEFAFLEAPGKSRADTLTDFKPKSDQLVLESDIFRALGLSVKSGEFRLGTRALDDTDHLIYDRSTGRLWYDANGDKAGGKLLFAVLETKPSLSFADFDLI